MPTRLIQRAKHLRGTLYWRSARVIARRALVGADRPDPSSCRRPCHQRAHRRRRPVGRCAAVARRLIFGERPNSPTHRPPLRPPLLPLSRAVLDHVCPRHDPVLQLIASVLKLPLCVSSAVCQRHERSPPDSIIRRRQALLTPLYNSGRGFEVRSLLRSTPCGNCLTHHVKCPRVECVEALQLPVASTSRRTSSKPLGPLAVVLNGSRSMPLGPCAGPPSGASSVNGRCSMPSSPARCLAPSAQS